MSNIEFVLALDVGSKRIGVALADSQVKISTPLEFVAVDGQEMEKLKNLMKLHNPVAIVVGYPRNQQGETTAQTDAVEVFAKELAKLKVPIVFQDESLTSVLAEDRLAKFSRAKVRQSVDSEAAAILLEDYMEMKYGH